MNIINKTQVVSALDKTPIDGLVLIQSYTVMPQKNGGQYIGGKLQALGDLSFKVWSSSDTSGAYQKMIGSEDFRGKICNIRGYVNVYGGEYSIIVESISAVDASKTTLSKADFLLSVYNADQYMSTLRGILSKYCTPNAVLVFECIMKDFESRFKEEFAAVGHHDNCRSGLLAHTTKVTRLATLVRVYPEIMNRVSPDVLFIGCALHDIGKVLEYDTGSISKEGFILSHPTWGVLILQDHSEEIIKLTSVEFYYNLLSIVQSHHGEFGEPPRTVAAFVVSLLDDLESKLTSLSAMLETSNSGQIIFSGYKLT